MKIINISNYKTEENNEYQVKEALKNVLFAPQLQLNSIHLIENNDIWQKIKASDKVLELEEAEYKILLNCIDTIKGYTLNDLVLINRIKEAKNDINKESD